MTDWIGGGIPVGYKYDSENKRLIPHPEHKRIVKTIYEYALSENSILQIVQLLNKRGILSRRGREWSYKTVSYLFSEKKIMFYAGFSDGQKGNWEPLIGLDEANLLIKKHTVKDGGKRVRKNIYLLPGLDIASCGYCNGTIKSSISGSKNKDTYYYLCSYKQMKGMSYCPESKVIRQLGVDDKVFESLKSQQRNIENIKKYSKMFMSLEKKSKDKQHKVLMSEIENLLKKQSSAKDNKTLKDIALQLSKKIKERNDLLSNSIIDFDFDTFKKAKLGTKDIKLKREIIKRFIEKIVLFNGKMIIYYPFIVNPKGEKFFEINI